MRGLSLVVNLESTVVFAFLLDWKGRVLILLSGMRTSLFAGILAFLCPLLLAAEEHWAFRPVERPRIPDSATEDPISWFIGQGLQEAGLSGAPTAARRDWVRRLYLNLTGLPPEFKTLKAHLASEEAERTLAKRLVEDLLSSPHYGERWARHWLDVARYSDTKGYAYGGEEFDFPHAWVYRDWVVKAFNEDLPYDQFIQRQIAADLLLEKKRCDRKDLAAMGFLTLGRRFIGVEPEIIDDRIDVVTRGLLGLTVSCARCHDHKFDPIPTADYYALYGVFKSSREDLQAIDPDAAREHEGLEKKKKALSADFEKRAREVESRFLERAADYMVAALDISVVPPPDFAEVIEKDDLNPAQIRRWYEFLSQESRREDPVFGPWLALSRGGIHELPSANVLVVDALRSAGADLKKAAESYQALFGRAVKEEGGNKAAEWREIRDVVIGPASPIRIPRDYIHDVEWLFDDGSKNPLKKQEAAIEREILGLERKAPHALVMVDRGVAQNVRIFERGHYPTQLGEVGRGSIAILHEGKRPIYRKGSGRLELAREITATSNPLTARVIVNRLWKAHFGEGLVRTESDFGTRSEQPSHPELLDFLAAEVMDSGWSLKHLQRLITTSAIYRRRAGEPPKADVENRLLSVYPRRRLDFEAMRDSMLNASGELDLKMGGPPGPLFGAGASHRRSIYGRIDRQFLPSTLLVFDFANPELHSPARYRTNVPQQALFLMNSPFTVMRAQALAARVEMESSAENESEKLSRLFQHVYQRRPTEEELASSLRFLTSLPAVADEDAPDPATEAWSYGYGKFDEKKGGIAKFHKLPHYDGQVWGGGKRWPDGALGWLRLTAEGGHTGNKVAHAAVRRWTSPVTGTLKLSGKIAKIEDCGDGLRAWVSSSRLGILQAWQIEFGKPQSAGIAEIEVEAGEILDFVIDCGEANNFSCDGFTWAPRLELSTRKGVWDAVQNFAGSVSEAEPLNVWERLAQALLISNEAMFLD